MSLPTPADLFTLKWAVPGGAYANLVIPPRTTAPLDWPVPEGAFHATSIASTAVVRPVVFVVT